MDFLLRNARIPGHESDLLDIAVADGRIAAIGSGLSRGDGALVVNAGGKLVLPGLVETHIHLDKACLLQRCRNEEGSLKGAIAEVASEKRAFTEGDVYARGAGVIEKAILNGIMRMRTHVEADPRVGLRGFHAVRRLAREYAWATDIQVCVFPQEGLLNDPGTEDLLIAALEDGADVLGACPYTDTDPEGQLEHIFALAKRFDVDIDMHLDFDLDPDRMDLDTVIRLTERENYGGRVTVGHVSKLSALPADRLAAVSERLSSAGIAVTVLPSTDLFLMGRDHDHLIPRGVAPAHALSERGVRCSLSTNNVLNPFTPFGDVSLIRIANLFANIAQLGRPDQFAACIDMVTSTAAGILNLADYGIAVGNPADLIVMDAPDRATALCEIAPPLRGFKRGRQTFERPPAVLMKF